MLPSGPSPASARGRAPASTRVIALAAAFALATPLAYAAQDGAVSNDSDTMIDHGHERVTEGFFDLVEWVDSWFGTEKGYDRLEDSWIRLRVDLRAAEDGDSGAALGLSGRYVLPAARRRMELVFSSNDDAPIGAGTREDDRAAGFSDDRDRERGVALRTPGPEHRRFRTDLDLGVRNRESSIRLFARASARGTLQGEHWRAHFSERLFYFTSLGFENEARLVLSRPLSDRWLFQSLSRLDWRERKPGFEFTERLSLIHIIDPRRSVAFDVAAFAVSKPDPVIEETQLRLRYRQQLSRDWMFIEARPVLAFPRDEDREPTWRFLLRLEMVFGRQTGSASLE